MLDTEACCTWIALDATVQLKFEKLLGDNEVGTVAC